MQKTTKRIVIGIVLAIIVLALLGLLLAYGPIIYIFQKLFKNKEKLTNPSTYKKTAHNINTALGRQTDSEFFRDTEAHRTQSERKYQEQTERLRGEMPYNHNTTAYNPQYQSNRNEYPYQTNRNEYQDE